MARVPVLPLFCLFGGLFALGPVALAKSGVAAPAGRGGPALASAPLAQPAGPGRHLRPGSGGRGFHRGAGHFGGYGGYGPGFYDSALYVIVPGGEPEERREPAERSIPVAVGIQRPPAADPVIYRIENHRGGQVARVIRIGAEGITPAYGGRTVPAGRR